MTAPPSPVVTILRGWNERQPSTPRLPHARPRERAPSAPAASSSERTSSGTASTRPSQSSGRPNRWTRDHGPRALGDRVGHLREIEVHRRRVDVDEHAAARRRARRRSPSPGTCTPGRSPRRRARCRARARRGGAPPCPTRRRPRAAPRRPRERVLELDDLRPHRQVAALEHLRDRARLLDADVRPRQPDRLVSHAARRGSRARAGPSSSSRTSRPRARGVITIGSFSLNDVLSTIGTPVWSAERLDQPVVPRRDALLDRLQPPRVVDVVDGRDLVALLRPRLVDRAP